MGGAEMRRRAFLVASTQTAVIALAARVTTSGAMRAPQVVQRPTDIERRVASIIEAYDAQGNHRTGTEVDRQSAEWLAGQVRRLGVEPALESFPLNRVDVRSCYVRVRDRRIDAVPLFDAGFTREGEITGVLGPLGSG